jgi:hypothetical protein
MEDGGDQCDVATVDAAAEVDEAAVDGLLGQEALELLVAGDRPILAREELRT